jgi:hypothetical protein
MGYTTGPHPIMMDFPYQASSHQQDIEFNFGQSASKRRLAPLNDEAKEEGKECKDMGRASLADSGS